MTIKQALIATVSISGVDDMLFEKSLLDADLLASDNYTKSSKEPVDKVAIEVLKSLLSQANVSEGDMSISYNVDAIKSRLMMLARQYNVDISYLVPTIKSRPVW